MAYMPLCLNHDMSPAGINTDYLYIIMLILVETQKAHRTLIVTAIDQNISMRKNNISRYK